MIKSIRATADSVTDPRNGPRVSFFSGGTGGASLMQEILIQLTWNLFVKLSSADNGGSSQKIGHVFPGSTTGDARAVLVRLARANLTGHLHKEVKPIIDLLHYRLRKERSVAEFEWQKIMEGDHSLWHSIPDDYKPIIKSDLQFFTDSIPADRAFDYSGACIGNLFLTGARLRMKHLGASINLFKDLLRIPYETKILPVIDSVLPQNIGCEMENGEMIFGQNEISHPGSFVVKETNEYLPSPIKRLFYYDEFRQEVPPVVNPRAIQSLQNADLVYYSVGSFWTSIMPSAMICPAIAQRKVPKVLQLNPWADRETLGMTRASHFVTALTRNFNWHNDERADACDLITDIHAVKGSRISVDRNKLEKMGIGVTMIDQDKRTSTYPKPKFDSAGIIRELRRYF